MRTDEIVDNSTDTLRRMNADLSRAVENLSAECAMIVGEIDRVRHSVRNHSHPKRWWEFWK
jgi:hypothetical protein